jgi:hypothetical protein
MKGGSSLAALHAVACHAAQSGLAIVLGHLGERVGDIGPAGDDLSQRVDRAGADVGVGMVEQLQSSRHEELLAGPAFALLAPVTCQRVQRTLQDLGIVVVQGGDQIGERGIVGEVIEEGRAQSPDDRLRVVHAAPYSGECRLAGLPQVELGSLAPFGVRELRDPAIEVGGGRKALHRVGTYARGVPVASDFRPHAGEASGTPVPRAGGRAAPTLLCCQDAPMGDGTEDVGEAITRHEVSRVIAADAAAIFAIVSSPSGHVAIDASGMLQASTGEPAKAVGDEFVVHMDRESLGDLPMGRYDVTVTITGYEQDRFITWEVSGAGFPSIGHYYGYRLEPNDDETTTVTSIYDWSGVDENLRQYWPVVPLTALKATLGILERTVRQSSVR